MDQTQLAIVISVVNETAEQLAEISTQLSDLAGQTASDASEMSSSMTAATTSITDGLTAAGNAATESMDALGEFSDDLSETIPGVTESAYNAISEMWLGISESAGASAQSSVQSWEQSLSELQDVMSKEGTDLDAAFASMTGEAVAAATTLGEEAGTAAGEGFGGYFKKMIIGYALEQIGTFLSGGVESAITAAAKSGDQIATLTAQIRQQKAEIDVNEAALQKWVGTTAEVNAAHAKAAANIEAEKVKITELTQQLAPLTQAQQGLTGEIQNTVNGVLAWIGAHKQLEDELQTFMTTLGPLLKYLGEAFIAITLLSVAFSVLDPLLLGLIGAALVIATLTAVWVTFHGQIVAFFDDLNAKTGIITFLQQAWDQVVQEFEGKLLPALVKLWNALQPLMPFLKALAEVIGATLLGALVLLVDVLTTGVTWFVNLLTAATNLATFFTTVLVGAINSVENALNAVFNSAAFKAVSGLVGGAVNAGSSLLNAVSAAVPKFATGGIVSSPTLALVGEAGPEAIIPLSAFNGGSSLGGAGGLGGGAGSINIYIQGGSYLNQGGAQQIAAALATQIRQQLKLTTV